MEVIACDVEHLHLGIADLDALLVGARVEGALDFQSGFGCRRADRLDDGETIRQRAGTPGLLRRSGLRLRRRILRNVAEHAVLDLIPLGCARRIVVDVEHEPCLAGELRKFMCPDFFPYCKSGL